MKSKDSKNSIECDSCGKILANRYVLKQHKNDVHAKLKLFACDTCEKIFSQKSTLKTHVKHVHEKIKPFSCQLCSKDYKTIAHL